MSTTKGAPSSRSFISFTVSPESARFCNCCSTVCLVERTLALLLLLFPLSPHQMLASPKSLLLLFTGFIGLEVRGWCEAAILTLSVITLFTQCGHMLPPRRLFHNWGSQAERVTAPGPTSDEGCTREWRGLAAPIHDITIGMKIAWQKLSAPAKMNIAADEQIVNCSAAERSAVYLGSLDGCYGSGFRWMEDCGGE